MADDDKTAVPGIFIEAVTSIQYQDNGSIAAIVADARDQGSIRIAFEPMTGLGIIALAAGAVQRCFDATGINQATIGAPSKAVLFEATWFDFGEIPGSTDVHLALSFDPKPARLAFQMSRSMAEKLLESLQARLGPQGATPSPPRSQLQ